MSNALRSFFSGPVLVAIAALFWASDALLRSPLTQIISSSEIVLTEHILVLLILLPWILLKHRRALLGMTKKEWVAAAFNGVCGSALALLFFTESFRFTNPSVAILLQKLQPVIVVAIAFVVLGERPQRSFYPWAIVAILAGIVLSFPDFNFSEITAGETMHAKGVLLALGASFLWACATVSGKYLLQGAPSSVALFWRFLFGLLTLFMMGQGVGGLATTLPQLSSWSLFYLASLSIFPGLMGMWVYYEGLSKTSASVTTMIELLYPILAIILNAIFLSIPLTSTQIGAGLVLTFAISRISH